MKGLAMFVLALAGCSSSALDLPPPTSDAALTSDLSSSDINLPSLDLAEPVDLGIAAHPFQLAPCFVFAGGRASFDVAAGDLDEDGYVDLIVPSYDTGNDLQIYLGNGDGTFRLGTNIAPVLAPRRVLAADMDNDGHLDLVVVGTVLSVFWGDGTGQGFVSQALGPGDAGQIAIADQDGDGDLDVLEESASTYVLRNDSERSFQQTLQLAEDFTFAVAAWLDYDLDGRMDIIAGADLGVKVLHSEPDGSFTLVDMLPFDAISGVTTVAGTPGKARRLVLGTTDLLHVVEIQASSSLDKEYLVGREPVGLAVADLNGDDLEDIVSAGRYTDGISVFINDGAGGFLAAQPFVAGAQYVESFATGVALADFNGDGRVDIAVSRQIGGIVILLNDSM